MKHRLNQRPPPCIYERYYRSSFARVISLLPQGGTAGQRYVKPVLPRSDQRVQLHVFICINQRHWNPRSKGWIITYCVSCTNLGCFQTGQRQDLLKVLSSITLLIYWKQQWVDKDETSTVGHYNWHACSLSNRAGVNLPSVIPSLCITSSVLAACFSKSANNRPRWGSMVDESSLQLLWHMWEVCSPTVMLRKASDNTQSVTYRFIASWKSTVMKRTWSTLFK